ncbi:WecB/TagA/CpsF family glycosyltransferase [Shewanella basaltis]|uniref:WecB/TagA/CpsF family glycosyltransferase n=1 Tax=Shewanella basaltis TaxID=472183 RepID=UPI00200C2D38|nr:WecB/TagA/CpsF family glycosyltransferase [Shewanella basaltis]MCL1113612.1 WecB/TagA/CpsF family glycosyltransferase [Shewanella basaltis]
MFINKDRVKDHIVKRLTLVDHKELPLIKEKIVLTQQPISVGFVNQHAYNLIHNDVNIKDSFDSLTYQFRDGMGLKIACKLNNCSPGVNLNGTDFIPSLVNLYLEKNSNSNVFVFGTQEPWLSTGSKNLLNSHQVTLLDGFKDIDDYLFELADSLSLNQKTLIILAMGMPKQELLAKEILKVAKGPVLVICGGAVIDFLANRFTRAPKLFRMFGLEWLYRLLVEPKRLFKRYVIGIPKFFFYILINRNI